METRHELNKGLQPDVLADAHRMEVHTLEPVGSIAMNEALQALIRLADLIQQWEEQYLALRKVSVTDTLELTQQEGTKLQHLALQHAAERIAAHLVSETSGNLNSIVSEKKNTDQGYLRNA
jgi:hypothetical protein